MSFPGFTALAVSMLLAPLLSGQTTQGVISGRVVNAASGLPVKGASVQWTRLHSGEKGDPVYSDDLGYYVFALLSPDTYELRAEAPGFQPQAVAEQELGVAERLDVSFRLRPISDVYGAKTDTFVPAGKEREVHFYAADLQNLATAKLDLLESTTTSLNATLSYLLDANTLQSLPLAGRDAYSLLVTLPGVTADTGTLRGLGLSVNGQRPTASDFLLDGVEVNNEAITGNLTPMVPEQIQEYRVSLSNFSAEYGRTSGFVANVVTPAGGAAWHGTGYLYFKNEALNANGARHPTLGLEDAPLPRLPLKEAEPGFALGGPLGRAWFGSFSADLLDSHAAFDPQIYRLPTASFVNSLPSSSTAAQLMRSLAVVPDGAGTSALVVLNAPAIRRRYSSTVRFDRAVGHSSRLFFRIIGGGAALPDSFWSPYREFTSPLNQDAANAAIGWIASGRVTNELRAGWTWDRVAQKRGQRDVPHLRSFDGDLPEGSSFNTTLPGSLVAAAYTYKDRTWQVLDNLSWTRYRHTPKLGGGLFLRHVYSSLDYYARGDFGFFDLSDFAAGSPDYVATMLEGGALPSQRLPNTARVYEWLQSYWFAQDSFRLSSRLSLDYGVRFESFGIPANVGTEKASLLAVGTGTSFPERLSRVHFAPIGSGSQPLYNARANAFAPRAGLSWSTTSGARPLVLRGSYGLFYDRPFDDLWLNVLNNSLAYGTASLSTTSPKDYFALAQVIAGTRLQIQQNFPGLILIQPGLRDPYVHSFFFGLEKALTDAFGIEAHYSGALGHELITTDVINRLDSNGKRFAPAFGEINYRANQGISSYNALTIVGRYRSRSLNLQVSYTWSRSIDTQTEPLSQSAANLNFANTILSGSLQLAPTQFVAQFDSGGERGNSDFDQRQNLIAIASWQIPSRIGSGRLRAALRGWSLAGIAALRSGFPFTVYALRPVATNAVQEFQVLRANLVRTGAPLYIHEAIPGDGVVTLDTTQFRVPGPGAPGIPTGRNEFTGPGLYNLDLSLGRTLVWKLLGDSGRLSLRADAFNFLNHANLSNPISEITNQQFGVSLAGRQDIRTGFPGSVPLDETGRLVQLSVRVNF
jgi:hypothetical protein